jgi:hypothetical protein
VFSNDENKNENYRGMSIRGLWCELDIAGEFARSGSGGEQASEAGTLSGRLGHAG